MKEKDAYLLDIDKNSLLSNMDRDCVSESSEGRNDFRKILLVRYPPKNIPLRS